MINFNNKHLTNKHSKISRLRSKLAFVIYTWFFDSYVSQNDKCN